METTEKISWWDRFSYGEKRIIIIVGITLVVVLITLGITKAIKVDTSNLGSLIKNIKIA